MIYTKFILLTKNKKPNVSNSKRKQKILRNRNEVSYSERRFNCNDIIRPLRHNFGHVSIEGQPA